jgi:hypothetical protein
VVNKLLSALDATFDPIVAEIKQRPDYEELHYVEVMTLLSLHEERMELENADQESSSEGEGEILSHYGSEQEEEDVENQHSITRELEMLTERLRDLRRQNLQLTNDDNVDLFGSSRKLPPKEIKCFKCKQFGHYIAECPSWEDEKPSNRWKYLHCNGFTRIDRHTKLSKKNEFSSSSSKRPVTDVKAKAAIDSNLKKISQLNRVCAEMNMESEDETSESESEDEELCRYMGRSNAFVAHESSEKPLESDTDDNASSDDEHIAFCLMAKTSKDQVSAKRQHSSEYIAYAKLVKLAKSQQDELERLEMNLRKTEGLLVEEMKKNQVLTEKHDAFSSTFDDLSE